jgi:hypothetical protein
MNNLNVDRSFATAAALEFTRQYKLYIPNQHNSELMGRELARLVLEEGADPHALETYRQAFSNVREHLELREPEERKSFNEMTPEELFALSPEDKDRLSTANLKRLANYELQRTRQRPELSEADTILRQLFEDQGWADSNENKAVVGRWMNKRGLDDSPANLSTAILACESSLAPSEKALDDMPSDEYRKAVVEPEFRKRQATQPRRESGQPWGVKYTEWIHNR